MTREEAIATLQEEIDGNLELTLREWRERDEQRLFPALRMAIEALTNVQNMHKGEWIKKQVFNPELDRYVPLIECSVCGYEPYFGGSESKFNYCANCGSRMKGGSE